MTRMHFDAIAGAIAKEMRQYREDATATAALTNAAIGIAEQLKGTNARFDPQRFYRACGISTSD